MDKFTSKIKESFNKLNPEKKRKVIVSIVIILCLLATLVVYSSRGKTSQSNQNANTQRKEISLESKMLEKSQFSEFQKNYKDLMDKVTKQEERLAVLEGGGNIPKETSSGGETPPPFLTDKYNEIVAKQKGTPSNAKNVPAAAVPPPIPFQAGAGAGTPTGPVITRETPPDVDISGKKEMMATRREKIGGIELVSQQVETKDKDKEKSDSKKKESLKIYLPPSFMEATLLSGLDAPTSEGAQGQPMPVLFRVKDLAVLPNRVKANLKGCFVLAEGYGNLSDERAHLRLTTLSCLSKKGESVIDQKIKGFVVDNDGKIGLRGRIVAKFGSKIAMSMLTGLFGGAGDALKQSSTYTTFSPTTGTTQIVNTDELTRMSIGGALSQAAKDLQKFYLDLGKQSLPVVEVGAMRNVTLVISEGISLEVKKEETYLLEGKYAKE